ncbi:MAG TPA: integrin alpha, partial [Alphaproteobacteria bacterium]|nr:integrin alpha [Alphaproteobacteria bacterium]
ANNYAGASYVIYGRKGGYPGPLDLANLSSAQGLVIQGAAQSDESGYSVSYAGDVNADGISDVIVGATQANDYTGASYVIYGNKSFSDLEPLPWTVDQKIKNQPHKIKNISEEKKTSKSIRAEKNAGVRIVADQKSNLALSQSAKINPPVTPLPDATSDGTSSHQIPWYSPARLWGTLKGFLSQNPKQVLDLTNRHVRNLVDLRGLCENLKNTAEESYDKWYGYSLEDLAESVTESLKYPETIREETVTTFEKRLQGIKKDFRRSNAHQSKLTFVTELESSTSLLPQERAFELLSIPSTPVLGSGTVPLALGY